MLIWGAESSKYFHHVIDLFFFFGSGLVKTHLFLEIEQLAANDKLFSSDSFVEFVVIDIDEPKFHLFLLGAVVFIELHFSEQKFRIVVVVDFKVSSFGHVAYDFCRVGAGLACSHLVYCKGPSF